MEKLIRKCPCYENNKNCKVDIEYVHEINFIKAEKLNSLCASCQGKRGSIKGVQTKRETGNWGIETKRVNNTLKHTEKAKNNISNGLKRIYETGERVSWNKGLDKNTSDSVAKTGKSRPKEMNPNYQKGYYQFWIEKYGQEEADRRNNECSKLKSKPGELNPNYGKKHSAETKEKIKQKRFNNPNGSAPFAKYNKSSIPIIENFGKCNNYNFRHAENHPSGEFFYKYFFADGYDEVNNVWIEYDEKHHFRFGKLKEYDVERQNFIINELDCLFIRIDYKGNITKYNEKKL